MAFQAEKNKILDCLRPIFPHLNDSIIEDCVETVQQGTVGENRAPIIPACIDLLLDRNAMNTQANHGNPHSTIVVGDEISYDESKRNQMDMCFEDTDINYVDDEELMYVATSIQSRGKALYLVDDDSPPIKSKPDSSSSKLDSVFVTGSSKQLNPRVQDNKPSKRESGYTVAIDSLSICPSSSIADPIAHSIKKIKLLFPEVQEKYLINILEKMETSTVEVMVSKACNVLLENESYPKEEVERSPLHVDVVTEQDEVNYLKNFQTPTSFEYKKQCLQLLENEFPMVAMKDIRHIASKHNDHYAPSRKCLEDKVIDAYSVHPASCTYKTPSTNLRPTTAGKSSSSSFRLLKTKRKKRGCDEFLKSLQPELQKEINFIKRFKVSEAEEKDRKIACILNEKQYEEEGQKIECGCCYGEATFEEMVQCFDGHLFCIDCLSNYAKEAVFGQGKATLSCMTSDCDSTFPLSQLKKSLTSNVLSKYEDRMKEESLCLAEMDDLVKCPSCDFAAVMPPNDKVFKCQNVSCGKETCRFCQEDWSEHFGLRCTEVEKKENKNVRLSYEEKMTMAKIRKCHKCGCEFTKSDGCNKMTCRCGVTMCYICRKPGISYSHFCQHPRDPGKQCTTCKNCSLWSDPSEDDDIAVKQLEKEADQAKKSLDTSLL